MPTVQYRFVTDSFTVCSECSWFRSHGSHLVCGNWLVYTAVRGARRLGQLHQVSSDPGCSRDVIGGPESSPVEGTVFSTKPRDAGML